MNKYIILIIGLGYISALQSQSVDEFIAMALDNNKGLEAIRLNYKAAKTKADQVADFPDPKINLGIGVLPIETRLGAQRFKIGVTQALPWKGLLNARKEAVASKAEVMAYLDEVKEIDIEFEIRKAYSTLIYLEDKKSIVRSKLDILDVLEELAKSALRSGKGKLSNVLFIQRTREAIISDLHLLQKQKESPTIMINRWTGRNLKEAIDIIPLVSQISNMDIHISYAESGHPSFNVLESESKASKKSVDLIKYERKPKIGVGLDYAFIDRRDGVELIGNGRDVLMPMGSISIPIHTGRFEARKQEDKLKQEAILAKMEDLKDRYKAEIYKAISDIEYGEMEVKKMKGLTDITKETLKLLRTEYASEGTKFEELLRLEMELVEYDLVVAKTIYKRLLAKAVLAKYQ
ncbi:MAG: TolC family protein [Saprospiraceae bacterium]